MLKQAKISKYRIEKILECFCLDLTATQTRKLLGFNRKTVNRWCLHCRLAIYWHQLNEFQKFVGEIEADESYFGARRRRGFHGKFKRGRGTLKQPVFGLFKRSGRVYTEIVPNCKKKTLQAIIQGKVAVESVMYTDGWRGYDGLVDVGYDRHFRVNHGANELSKGQGVHINGIESFWSFAKRRLVKFNGVKANFTLHLKECEWRWGKESEALRQELRFILKEFEKI